MIEINTPKIDIDEIMARIREEVQQQKNKPCHHFTGKEETPFSPCSSLSSPTITPAANPLPHKEFYALSDFLGYHDSNFIDNAYFSILGRAPDSGGGLYLSRLQNGELTKVDIVGRLRYSREGRSKKVAVKGLLLPFILQTFFKIPVLGWALRLVTGVLNLPAILKNMQVMENAAFTQITEQKKEIEEAVAELSNELAKLSRQMKGYKLTIIDTQRRMQLFLEEARKRFPEPISIEQIENMVKEEDHLFDAMFVEFEEKFRGTREDIKKRVNIYLPYVENTLTETNDALVLDIGCGRGEWLELLKENNIIARGLDLNRIMVAQCRELGLDVIEADLIEHLRNLKNNTLSVITGFHIIEHLPFKTLIALFDESIRVLKPGGLVIFETPNPENILVGAHYFYNDPTHINPLVAETIQFLIEQRGFDKVEIKRLHKYSDLYSVETDIELLRDNLCNEMDYSVIGYKI